MNDIGKLFVNPPSSSPFSEFPDPRTPENPLDPQKSSKEWCIESARAKKKFLTKNSNNNVCSCVSDDEDHQRFTIEKYD